MKPRAALLAAIACGAAAVALVAVDLAYNVDARLEVRGTDGVWRLSASTDTQQAYPVAPVCGSHFRFTLHNGLPWGLSRHVTITASGNSGTTTLLDETWSLGGSSDKVHEFDAPNGTFDTPPANPSGAPVKATAGILVSLGSNYMDQLFATACKDVAA